MTKETMNVHKALCELKILDDRIIKAIKDCEFVGVKKVASKMVGSVNADDFREAERNKYGRVVDLMKRREAIKRAVVLSNATTKVLVGGVEYTVAEAIEMKNHGLDGKRKLMNGMAYALEMAERKVEITNTEADRKADLYVQGLSNGKDVKSEETKAIREGYLAGLVVELVDPLPKGARSILDALEEEINSFMVEVDAALSTSNALTQIEVEY